MAIATIPVTAEAVVEDDVMIAEAVAVVSHVEAVGMIAVAAENFKAAVVVAMTEDLSVRRFQHLKGLVSASCRVKRASISWQRK